MWIREPGDLPEQAGYSLFAPESRPTRQPRDVFALAVPARRGAAVPE